MIHNYAKFINGEIFTQKDVLRILDDNKIEGKIINIKFYQYKKIYIQVKKNKKKYFFKLCLHKHSIDLSKNESDGYDYFSKIDKPEFNLPNYKLINITQNYSLSEIEFIEGSRGNYFELSKFYNNCFSKNYKIVNLQNYISSIVKKNQIDNDKSKKIDDIIKIILEKYKSISIPVEASHGDFIGFNTIKNLNKNYVFDLEFFQKERSLLYDYFHWKITPIIGKSLKYNCKFILKKIFIILSKILYLEFKIKYKKTIINNERLFQILLILFLLERHIFLRYQNFINQIEGLVSQDEKNLLSINSNLYMNLLIKIL
ncbi:hypothetical protein OAS64_02995 [Candidatus Pelagibacter sp.]|nr:hypothetical protein [Candidatus Pelagibacter sp.]